MPSRPPHDVDVHVPGPPAGRRVRPSPRNSSRSQERRAFAQDNLRCAHARWRSPPASPPRSQADSVCTSAPSARASWSALTVSWWPRRSRRSGDLRRARDLQHDQPGLQPVRQVHATPDERLCCHSPAARTPAPSRPTGCGCETSRRDRHVPEACARVCSAFRRSVSSRNAVRLSMRKEAVQRALDLLLGLHVAASQAFAQRLRVSGRPSRPRRRRRAPSLAAFR